MNVYAFSKVKKEILNSALSTFYTLITLTLNK